MIAPVEDRDFVSAPREPRHDLAADEQGSADHESSHAGIIDRCSSRGCLNLQAEFLGEGIQAARAVAEGVIHPPVRNTLPFDTSLGYMSMHEV
jgi:hypothetical protein